MTKPQYSGGFFISSVKRLGKHRIGLACLVIIGILYGSGMCASLVSPYGYNEQNLLEAKQGPSVAHPFGTDRLGRDILSRVIYGLRTTVIITLTSLIGGSLLLGITFGLIAGYYGRWVDGLVMRIGEITSSFPDIFLVLLIVATVKPRLV